MTFFSHLHVHSEYSLMESTIKIKDLINTASINGMKAVALTDKYVMSGAIEFYKEAVRNNIKPIIGCEICVRNNEILSHFILLAENIRGYGNLCRIVSKSHLEKNGPLPAVEFFDIQKMSEGLIGLGCSKTGEVSLLIKAGKPDKALQSAFCYMELFGGNFFLEIQRYPERRIDLRASSDSEILINFAAKHNLPIIATNNVHYLVKDDYRTYRYLFKIKSMGIDGAASGKPVCNDEHYFKSQAEMISMFGDIPQAISAANLIENKCELKLPLISINTSLYKKKKPLPDEIKENKTGLNKAEVNKAEAKHLKNLCFKNGLKRRYGDNLPLEIYDRLKKELDIIIEMGLCKYFLVAADIAEFARENNIPICGKGSSAGSLVSYLLGISDIDPIENNLYFERFLNRERREPPDIDIDISSKRRTEIIKYLTGKYGTDSIARVCTFSTLKQDAAVREAGRILGLGKEEVADENIIGEETVNEGTVNKEIVNPKKNSCKEISYISRKIKDYPRHVSMHPSAFIISGPELDEKIPLTLSGTGEIMSQYDIDSVKEMGLLKIDLISSLTLSLVDDVATMLKKTRNIDFNPREIKYDDATTFNLIKNGDTLGVFQLESSGIRQLAKKIKPSTLNDITHLISLYRPAPSATGMTGNFIERKMGREKITYIHRDLEPILNETYGIILYQEQVMRIAVCIAGYSLSEADNLRKAVKASSEEEIKSQAGRFVEGAISRGYSKEQAEKIFKLISLFTNYSFVKAHAAAYAGLSYKVCYIKAHYPAELISVILTNNSGYYAAALYIEEARRCGIKIKLPDINKSGFEFSVEDEGKSIRVPLLAINGLGRAGVESILHERAKEKNFENFTDFYYRTSGRYRITDKAIENLIKAGAFDFEGQKRKQLLLYYHYLKSLKTSRNTFGSGSASSGMGSGSGTISTGFLPFIGSNSRDFSFDEKLVMEEKIFGFCASYSPLEYYRNELVKYPVIESSSFSSAVNKKIVFTAGIVISRKTIKTKSGRDMLLCIMEDRGGMYEAVFFPNGCRKNYKIITRNSILIIKGILLAKDGIISVIGRNFINAADLKKTANENKNNSIKNDLLKTIETGLLWIV